LPEVDARRVPKVPDEAAIARIRAHPFVPSQLEREHANVKPNSMKIVQFIDCGGATGTALPSTSGGGTAQSAARLPYFCV
jgi:hypothetical protein